MKTLYKTCKLLLFLIIFGFLSIYYVHKIPVGNIRYNIKKSLNYDLPNNYKREFNTYDNIVSDYYTDGIILGTTLSNISKITLVNSLSNYYYRSTDFPLRDIKRYLNNELINIENYSRYWNGYTIPLKVLLSFFNLSDVYLINYLFQNILIIVICIFLYKKNLKMYIIPFIFSLISMGSMFIYKSLSYSICFNIMLIFTIYILVKGQKLNKENIKYIFLIIGAATSYFDFLCFPLITLGYPMIIYFLLNKNISFSSLKECFILLLFWSIGYIGMWFGKWLIASIFLNENIILEAYDEILLRTGNIYKGLNINNFDVISLNFDIFINKLTLILFGYNVIFIIYKFIKNKLKLTKINMFEILIYIIIAILPFIWYILTKNHSYEHAFFTYRILSITYFSIIIILYKFYNIEN